MLKDFSEDCPVAKGAILVKMQRLSVICCFQFMLFEYCLKSKQNFFGRFFPHYFRWRRRHIVRDFPKWFKIDFRIIEQRQFSPHRLIMNLVKIFAQPAKFTDKTISDTAKIQHRLRSRPDGNTLFKFRNVMLEAYGKIFHFISRAAYASVYSCGRSAHAGFAACCFPKGISLAHDRIR